MKKFLLLGDEAVGQAAIDAGITACYGYPGTPSTEIFEYVENQNKVKNLDIHVTWAANEKVAYEQALGVSYVGRRSIVTMKHVGLNVAADAFINSAITGTKGGLVLAIADDPSMHSSQNEQDSRFYADFAKILCLEPTNQQMAYDMTRDAFDISEKFGIPVMVRLVTRLAHSRSGVVVGTRREQNELKKSQNARRWTLLPSNARVQYKILLEKQKDLLDFTEKSSYNEVYINKNNNKLGVIVSGIAFNYFMENFQDREPLSYLRINTYPLPIKKIKDFISKFEKVLFIEEGYPFIEGKVLGLLEITNPDTKFLGRFNGVIPESGELNADIVADALNEAGVKKETMKVDSDLLKGRPPQLCPGCPHFYIFQAMNDARKKFDQSVVFSDIGCYTLGFYEPLHAIESCVDMGASIGMAKGASDAGMHPVLCAIGDSTFGHSGITPLLTAAQENTNMTVFILDNSAVAMTGAQESLTTGEYLMNLLKGLNIPEEHIRVINPIPKNHDENVKVILEEINYNGLSVIISKRPCLWVRK